MIERLDNKNIDISKKIHSVFQVSYTTEAKLLNVMDFPPLKRSVEDFIQSNSEFYGYRCNEEIVAIIEIESNYNSIHINSLVVDPKYFRQGIAQELLTFIIESTNSITITVDTAVDNTPACTLYKKFEFRELEFWETEIGIKIVRFEKKIKNQV